MRRSFLFRAVFISFAAMFLSISCKGDSPEVENPDKPNIEEPDQPDEPDALLKSPFSLEVTCTSHEDPWVEVVADDDDENDDLFYTVGIISKADYESTLKSDDAKFADYIIEKAKEAGADFESDDNVYVFDYNEKISLAHWGELTLDEEYLVGLVALNEKGEAATELVKDSFVAEEIAPMTMTLDSVSKTSIIVDIAIRPSFGNYYVAPIPVEVLNYDYNGKVENAVKDAITDIIVNNQGNFNYADNTTYVFNRSAKVDISNGWDLSSDTEYVIMAFGVLGDGTLTSEIYSLAAKTLPEVEILEGTFKLGVGDMEPDNVHVTVEKSGDIANYIVFAYNAQAFEDNFYSYADYLVDEVTYDMVTSGFDFTKPDGVRLFSEESIEIDLKNAQSFAEGQSYVVMAVGVDEMGRCNSVPEFIYAETSYFAEPEVDGSITMELVETTVNNIIVKVEEIGAVNSFVVAACPMDNFTGDYNSDPEKMIQNILEFQLSEELALPDGYRVFEEGGTLHLGFGWPISANSSYKVIAFGVSREKERNTNYVMLDATTPAAPRSANEITITCSNVTTNEVTVSTTVTNEDPYYLTLLKADMVEGKSDEEIFQSVLAPYGQLFDTTVAFNTTNLENIEYAGLYADTKYYAVAFVYGYGSLVSEVFRSEPFTTSAVAGEVATLTPEEIVLSDVDFGEIVVGDSFQYNLMSVDVKPVDKSVKYLFFLKESSEVTKYETDQELIAADYLNIKETAGYQSLTFAETFSTWLHSGDYSSKNGIYPSKTYILYAYGVDTVTYQPVTAVEKIEVVVP